MEVPITEIRSDSSRRVLALDWADELHVELPHALLRRRCACAQCRQPQRMRHRPAADDVVIEAIEPYGANAIQIKFSDRHSRGIFPFAYLRALAEEADAEGG